MTLNDCAQFLRQNAALMEPIRLLQEQIEEAQRLMLSGMLTHLRRTLILLDNELISLYLGRRKPHEENGMEAARKAART